jgi:hypothetical protein
MKLEIRSTVIVCSVCGALVLAAHNQRPECVPGRDWCEVHAPRLAEGHDREPAPADTGSRIRPVTVATSTSTWAYTASVRSFPFVK